MLFLSNAPVVIVVGIISIENADITIEERMREKAAFATIAIKIWPLVMIIPAYIQICKLTKYLQSLSIAL